MVSQVPRDLEDCNLKRAINTKSADFTEAVSVEQTNHNYLCHVSKVPRDVVDRNLKRATDAKSADFTEAVYECYGAGATGFVVEALTDNLNRAAAEVRYPD